MANNGQRPKDIPEGGIAVPEKPLPKKVVEPGNFDKPKDELPNAAEIAQALAGEATSKKLEAGYGIPADRSEVQAEALANEVLGNTDESVKRTGAFASTPAVSRPWTIEPGTYRARADANRTQDSTASGKIFVEGVGWLAIGTIGTAAVLTAMGVVTTVFWPLTIAGGIVTLGGYVLGRMISNRNK